MSIDACERLGEISLLEKVNSAIPAQPASHRACEPLGERSLRFRVTHGTEFLKSTGLNCLLDETRIGERQQI